LVTSKIDSHGKFTINKPLSIPSNLKSSTISYVLKAEGCNSTYLRPLTGFNAQNITSMTTLVVMATTDTFEANKIILPKISAASFEKAITSLAAGEELSLDSSLQHI